MSDFPKIVALDTDWTMWQNYLDGNTWGKGRGAFNIQEDNVLKKDNWVVYDNANRNRWIKLFDDVPNIIYDILKNGAQLAIVTRNPAKHLSDRALRYLSAMNPKDGNTWSIIDMVTYDEVYNKSKTDHFIAINGYSGQDFNEMVLYDDEAYNNAVRIERGVTFQLCRNKKGLNWTNYQRGIYIWRRQRALYRLKEPSSSRHRVMIGYSGLPQFWIDTVRNRVGVVDPKIPYRWGYGLYVTESLDIAQYFSGWNDGFSKDQSYVCEVWVNDYDMWKSINKIWVPESSSILPQMNNMNWSYEATGLNQENRDDTIASRFGVQPPYVLFSNHFWMSGMPPPARRWAEMVIYTEVRRALVEVVPMTKNLLSKPWVDRVPFPFHKQMKRWNITVPRETQQDFLRHGERDYYNASL